MLLFDTKQYIGQDSLMIVFIGQCVIDLGRIGEERWAEGNIHDYERALRRAVASAQQVHACRPLQPDIVTSRLQRRECSSC